MISLILSIDLSKLIQHCPNTCEKKFIIFRKIFSFLLDTEAQDQQQHVMFQLGEQHGEGEQHQPPAFVELDELYCDPNSENPPEWREVARFVNFIFLFCFRFC